MEIVGRVIGGHFSRPLHDQFIIFPIIRPPHDHILIRPTVGPIVHFYDFMIVNTTLTQPHMPYDQPHTQPAQRLGKYSSLGYNYFTSAKRLMPPPSVLDVL